ncbi:MAG: hypothetical protein JOZ07_04105 [Solirubrobacterales bacterium]|nr:hypothetical protein [Solirubrobacterales bacterium]
MSFIVKHARLLVVAVCCLAVGAGASVIATAGAATSHQARPAARHLRADLAFGLPRLVLRSVHGDFVVHTKSGFATVTVDRGVVQSVSGQQLTVQDGTPKATYQTVTLTIPSTAQVRDNGQKASLSAVQPGQRVVVIQAPKRTLVAAHNAR